ncbi:MAG: HEAT repeat domain-containing protein [Planctomycetota bacterium]|jgi:hypothetical protein
MGHDDPELAEQAGAAVLVVTVAAVGPTGRRQVSNARRESLERLVVAALESPLRRRAEAVLVAGGLLMVRPGAVFGDLIEQPQHPVLFALRGVAERLSDSTVRRNLLNWLGVEMLRGPAARWIHRIAGLEAWSDLLSGGHLLLHPRRRNSVRQVDRPVRCLPDLTLATTLPAAAQARLPHFLAGLDLSADLRARRLADLIALPSPVARWQVLMTLLRQHAPRADRAVEQFCFDRRGFIARLATQHRLAHPGDLSDQSLASLQECGHSWVADRARSVRAGRSASAFFSEWLDLTFVARLAAAHQLAAVAPTEFQRGLADTLESGSRRSRLAAIEIIRRLRDVPAHEEAIIELATGPDARVASAAATALADGCSPRRLPVLLAALQHDDARVRANAIETLMRAGGAGVADVVRPHARSAENRPRANAVRALLRARPADGEIELKSILADDNPLHRISGLWVARRAGHVAAHHEVRHLAEADRVPEIRGRACAVLRFLLAQSTSIDSPLELARP